MKEKHYRNYEEDLRVLRYHALTAEKEGYTEVAALVRQFANTLEKLYNKLIKDEAQEPPCV